MYSAFLFAMDFITRRNAAPTAACRVAAYELCNFISICGRKEPGAGGRGEGGRTHLLRRLHTRRNHTLFRHPTHSTHSTFTPNSCAQERVVRKTAWLNYFSIIWFATSFKMATKILRVECEPRSAGDAEMRSCVPGALICKWYLISLVDCSERGGYPLVIIFGVFRRPRWHNV